MVSNKNDWKTYLEIKAMEEASEVQQSISKNMIFGAETPSYYTNEPNVKSFGKEVQDFLITIELLVNEYGMSLDDLFTEERDQTRREKMKYYYDNYWRE